MVKQIASRAAGMRLFLIVAILMLPIFVLGYYALSFSLKDREILTKEFTGAQMNELLMPILLGALQAKIDPADIARFENEGGQLAENLGISDRFKDLKTRLALPKKNYTELMNLSNAFIAAATDKSGLILDSEAESFYLVLTTTSHIPNTLLTYKEAQYYAFHSMSSMPMKQDSILKLLVSLGRWSESLDNMKKSMVSAGAASSEKASYTDARAILNELVGHAKAVSQIVKRDKTGSTAIDLVKAGELAYMTPHIVEDTTVLWKTASQKLNKAFTQRIYNANFQLALMAGIASITTLIGVGFAASMFRSTLKQLDLVGAAKDEANQARDAAEDMSQKLLVINEDVGKLNRDLEINMRKLTDAQAEIVRKTKFANLGQLTATVAHELRNPLGAVRTSAFLLERKLKDKGLGVEAQLLRINNGITRCDDTITQLLDFSRSKQVNSTMVELDQWLVDVVEEEARKLPPSVSITCSLGLDGRHVPLDKTRMQRAIINIVSNASEAMVGKGEGTISNVTKDPTINIETRLVGEFVELVFTDNGPGISADNLLKIREPMFTTKNFGTGLGIPAVEQILEQHNGTLEIQSTIGNGAQFTMRLPLVQFVEEEEAA